MKLTATMLTLASLTLPSYAAAPRACRSTTFSRASHVHVVATSHATNHHVAKSNLVITAFAVPVAVPVAPFAPYWYGVSDYYDAHHAIARSAPLRADVEARTGETASDARPQSAPLRTGASQAQHPVIAQKCTSCHGRTSPKQGLSLVDPLSLSAEDRLRAIRAVVNGEMPPDTESPLTDADRAAILRELTAE
jgi:cytochrome c553